MVDVASMSQFLLMASDLMRVVREAGGDLSLLGQSGIGDSRGFPHGGSQDIVLEQPAQEGNDLALRSQFLLMASDLMRVVREAGGDLSHDFIRYVVTRHEALLGQSGIGDSRGFPHGGSQDIVLEQPAQEGNDGNPRLSPMPD
jgi:hypothetical protein